MDLRGFNTYAQVLRKRKPHVESNRGDQSYNSFGSQRKGLLFFCLILIWEKKLS